MSNLNNKKPSDASIRRAINILRRGAHSAIINTDMTEPLARLEFRVSHLLLRNKPKIRKTKNI